MTTETVRVVVRSRPLSKSEKNRGNFSILQFEKEINQIAIQDPKTGVLKTFAYDSVYDTESTQQELYDESAFPLVESALQGYNSTIFAYGQTGCGKTFTMLGIPNDLELRGIIPNSFAHIFGCISEAKNKLFLVKCSYIEIYNEEIRDLLNYDAKKKLELKESPDKGIFINGVSKHDVKSTNDIAKAMESGNTHRIVKETAMNDTSSRSHAIFIIYVESSEEAQGRTLIRAGKLNLVDLAGSERQKKTGAEGDRLKEAIKINLSLSALGNVINALVEKSRHVPYRDSKLTLLLEDSLGGNTKTLMIAVVSPADYNFDETISTLRYASRAKFIQNKPKINEDPKDAQLREYLNEIQRLKALLNGNGPQVIERVVEKIINVEKSIDDDSVQLPTKLKNKQFKESITLTMSDDLETSNNKVQLESMIKDIQTKLVHGGEELDKVEKERLKAQKKFRRKLKKQEQKQKKLIEENKKKEEEILNIEKKYQSANEEIEDLRNIVKELRNKYRVTMNEIKNSNHLFEDEKEDFYEDLRNVNIENEFLNGLLEFIMPISEVELIKKKSTHDENNKKWIVPDFFLENRQKGLPKISQDINKFNNPAARMYEKKSKKRFKNQDYFSDQTEFEYENAINNKTPEVNEKINEQNGRVFREHFPVVDKRKKEVAMSFPELPQVNEMNKKMIADGFSNKKRKGFQNNF